MKECIFSLGKLNKKFIWPFLFSLTQVALSLVNRLFPEDKVNHITDTFAVSANVSNYYPIYI